jgi:L-asparaginase II
VTTVLAEVHRGGEIESIHHGVVAVANIEGKLVATAGDPNHFAFFRSSAKPFQALPAVISGAADAFGFTPAELALCCASHHAERHHQLEVAGMLAKLGLSPDALRCGAPLPGDETEAGRVAAGLVPRSPLQCDCSGKHTGMLAACLQYGFPIENYLEPTHPLQRQILEIMAAVMRMPEGEIRLGTDGCSLPTFGAPLAALPSRTRRWPNRSAHRARADANTRRRSAASRPPC